jgi:mono/diheme cytochrome c family protein
MSPSRWYAIFAAFVAIALIAGCNKEPPNANPNPAPGNSGPPGPSGGPEPTGPHAEGIKVFNQKCGNCHSTTGAKKRAPDLGKIAADPTHDEEWLRAFILNPSAHMKKMPPVTGISDDDMKKLTAYLVTLK